jgi:hypothetical protein
MNMSDFLRCQPGDHLQHPDGCYVVVIEAARPSRQTGWFLLTHIASGGQLRLTAASVADWQLVDRSASAK